VTYARQVTTAAYTYLCGAQCEEPGVGLQLEVPEVLHHQRVRVLSRRLRVCVKQERGGNNENGITTLALCVASMNADTTQ
jgi:hypothetical protein